MSLTTAQLLERYDEEWRAATVHPFLEHVREGTLSEPAFARWLEQDYLFVVGLTRAWGQLVARAPVEHFGLLTAGIRAFSEELTWFEELANSRALRLGEKPAQGTADYVGYLEEVAVGPYAVAITAMWAVEAAYLRAWQGARGGSTRYADLVEHWVSEEFATFVAQLARVADRELGAAPELWKRAEGAFVAVARHETLFWGIAGVT